VLLVLGFATVLQIAGLPASALPPTSIDSVGMWDAISSGDPEGPRTTLVHHAFGDGSGKIRRRSGGQDWQLYSMNTTLTGGLEGLCNPTVDGWRGNPTVALPCECSKPSGCLAPVSNRSDPRLFACRRSEGEPAAARRVRHLAMPLQPGIRRV